MRIFKSNYQMQNASRVLRCGRITAERHLTRPYVADYDEYSNCIFWEAYNGRCVTNYKGDLLRLELEV